MRFKVKLNKVEHLQWLPFGDSAWQLMPCKNWLFYGTVTILLLFCASSFYAATITWTGSVSSDWNTAANWSPSVPTSSDNVLIPGNLSNYPVINSAVTVRTIVVNSTGSGATLTITTGAVLTLSGAGSNYNLVAVGGTLTQNGGTVTLLSKVPTIAGVFNFSGGTIYSDQNINITGMLNQSGGLIRLAKDASTNPSDHLLVTGGTVNQSGGTIYTKDFYPSTGYFYQTGSTAVFQIFRDWKPTSGHTFLATNGTVQFSGTSSKSTFNSSNAKFYNMLVDAGVNPRFDRAAGYVVNLCGNFTNNNTALNITSNVTFTFSGSDNQTIFSASTGTNSTFFNTIINKTAGTVTLASNVNISGALTVKANGTFNLSTYNLGAGKAPTSLNLECGAVTGSVISGTGTLNLGGNVTVTKLGTGNAGAIISCPLALGANRTLTVEDDGTSATDLSVSGIISGAFSITKTGTGMMVLSGMNTYTGATTINQGIVSISNITNGGVAGNLGASTNAAANLVLGGGRLQYTGSSGSTNRNFTLTAGTSSSIEITTGILTISGASTNTTGALTKLGTGTLVISGANLYTGLTTVSNGILQYGANNALSSGAVTVAGGVLDIGSFSDVVSTVTLASGSIAGTTGVLTGTSYILQSGTASAILGGTGTLTKSTAQTATLTGANTYTGQTIISGGRLVVNSIQNVSGGASALGAPTTTANGTINIAGNGTLCYNGTGHSSNRIINLTGSGGTIEASGSGTLTLTGGATGNTFNLVLAGTGTGIISGVINTTTGAMTKSGIGTWTISGTNTYTGATTLSGGTLTLGSATSIANTSPVVFAGGTFRTGATTGFGETVGTLTANAFTTIVLGTGSHSLTFAASNSMAWASIAVITVTGWTGGYNGTSGTAGKIFVGNNASGLTSAQLAKIRFFNGTNYYQATQLSTGEVVPTSTLYNVAAPTDLSYNSPNSFNNSSPITPLTPTVTGTVESFSVNPALPTGLVLNPYTGEISGSPLSITPEMLYRVTATNINGSTFFDISITITSLITNSGSGNWSSTIPDEPWPGGTVPNSLYEVTIKEGTTVTVDIPNAECQSLTIGLGTGTATIAFTTAGNPGLTVYNDLVIGGSGATNRLGSLVLQNGSTLTAGTLHLGGTGGTPAPGTVNMSAGGTLEVNSFQVNNSSGTWTPGTGTVKLLSTNTLPSSVITSFNNLILETGTTTTGVTLPSLSGGLTIGAGATFLLNHNVGSTTGPSSLNLYCGGTSLSSISGSGTLKLGGNIDVTNLGIGTLGASITCPMDLNGNRTLNVEDDGSTSPDLSISGVISGSGGITTNGEGKIVLTGLNTYTGKTVINNAILCINSIQNATVASALGAPSTSPASNPVIDLSGNSTLLYTGAGHSSNRQINITGTEATIEASGSGTLTLSGGFSGSGMDLILSGSGTAVQSGVIAIGSGTLTKLDIGTWSLSGSNTFTGLTEIEDGTLTLASSGALPSANSVLVEGILNLAGLNRTLGTMEGSGTVTSSLAGPITLTVGNSTSFEFSGDIEDGNGTVNLTKAGTGIFTLSGACSYTGTTNINTGTLMVGLADGVIPDVSNVTVTGTLDLAGNNETIAALNGTGTVTSSVSGAVTLAASSGTFAGIIQNGSGTVSLNKIEAGVLTLSGANSYSGQTTISNGTLICGASEVIPNQSAVVITSGIFNLNGFNETIGSLEGTNGTVWSSVNGTPVTLSTGANNTNTTFNGTIFDSFANFALTKTGTGTFTLGGNNSHQRTTTVSQGTLKLASASALGGVAGNTIVASGAVLDLNGITYTIQEPLTINGTGISGSGAVINSSTSAATFAGLLTLGNSATITGGDGLIYLTNTGTITGNGFGLTLAGAQGGTLASVLGTGAGTLTKTGAGIWTVSGSSTFTGATTIIEGTLKLGSAGNATNSPLGTSASGTTVSSGAALDLNGFSLSTTEALILNGTGVNSLGALTNSSTTAAAFSSSITFQSAASIVGDAGAISVTGSTVSGATDIILGGTAGGSFSSTIAGNRTLTKEGSGIWTLSGLNSYTGATSINNGTLRLGSAGNGTNTPLGTTAAGTTVASGAALDLNGFTLSTTEPFTLNGTGVGGTGALTNSSSTTATYNGILTFNTTASVAGEGGLITIAAPPVSGTTNVILGGAAGGNWTAALNGARLLTKDGTGTWSISVANAHSGGTTLNAGTLSVSHAQALGTSGTFTINGGTLSNNTGSNLTLPNYPWTLNGNFTYTSPTSHNLNQGSGAISINGSIQVTVNAGTLALGGTISSAGSLTKAGAGTLNIESPTVELNNLSATAGQLSLNGTSYLLSGGFSGNGSSNITLSAPMTVSGNFSLSGTTVFEIAAAKTLTVGGTFSNTAGQSALLLKSDASGTASLLHQSDNVPATVQRYITGNAEDWHFLSSPVSNQSISGTWLPSGTYSNGHGYDLYVWDEPTPCWVYQLNSTVAPTWPSVHPTSNFVTGRGYLYSVQESNPTKVFSGNLNNGNLNFNITSYSPDLDLKGFNLIGNPYPSSADWRSASGWTRNNLDMTGGGYDLWIWNPAANNYGVVNSAGTGPGTNGITQYIPPMQGFFVKAATNGTIGLANDIRVHDGANFWRSPPDDPLKDKIVVRVASQAGDGYDEIILQFGYPSDEPGAAKIFSHVPSAPSLYMAFGNMDYSIGYFTQAENHPSVPFIFKAGRNGKFTLSADFNQEDFNFLTLEDRKTGTLQDLKKYPSYSFEASVQTDPGRFVLHFVPVDEASRNLLPVRIYYDGSDIVVDLTAVSQETTVRIADSAGRTFFNGIVAGKTIHRFPTGVKNQVLVVSAESQNRSVSQKVFVY